jgi:hypothetical protein
MTIYELLILEIVNILCLIIGVRIGQKVAKKQDIQLNPITSIKKEIREAKDNKKNELKQRQIDAMLQNIDNYDGTGLGQRDIPKE